MKFVFKKGFMFILSINTSVILYISENKSLAGKEDRTYEGEALGRKLAITFFERADGDLVRRTHRETLAMQPQLLTVAEILQALGFALPPDPSRTAATAELLMESHYENLEIERFECHLEPDAPEVHMYRLEHGELAEAIMTQEVPPEHRTKMMLARCLQRNEVLNEGETLQAAWSTSLADLRVRAAPHLPAPVAAPPAPPAAPAPGGGRGRGRGRGRAAPPAPQGRARGGARGGGRR